MLYLLCNGSSEGDNSVIKKKCASIPFVTIINSEYNRGFAGGSNYLIKTAKENDHDFYILINNDTILDRQFVQKVDRELVAINDDKIGIFVPTIYYYDSDLSKKNIWRAGDSKKVLLESNKIKRPVGCIYGISEKLINKIGYFDENFFAYGEEVDYNYRAKKAGFSLCYLPKVNAWHKVVEHADSELKTYLSVRNNYYLYNKRNFLDRYLYFTYFFIVKLPRKFFLILYKNKKNLPVFFRANKDGLAWIKTGKKPRSDFITETERT